MQLNSLATLCALALIILSRTHLASADEASLSPDAIGYRATIGPFLKEHCLDCHGTDMQEGDVRFDTLDSDIVRGTGASLWKDILHRLETGEMPPEDEPQPKQQERDAVTEWIRQELRKNLTAQYGVPGRVVVRRLSRNEYRNTMRDLLGLDYDVGGDLPPDTTYHGFDHIADVQELSPAQMEMYLEFARYAVDKALVTGERPLSFQYRSEPEQQKEGLQWRVVAHGVDANVARYDEIKEEFRPGRGEQPMQPDEWGRNYRFGFRLAAGRHGSGDEGITKTGVWLQAPRDAYAAKGGEWGRLGYRLPYRPKGDGLFRLRIKAGAKIKEDLGTPLLTIHIFKKHLADIEIDASADAPQWYEFVFAEKDLTDVQIHSDDNRFSKTPITDIVLNNGYENPGEVMGHKGWTVPEDVEIPGVFVDAVEFEANYHASWPPVSHRRILFDSPNRDQPEAYAEEILTRFMSQAFRRPIRPEELAGKLKLFRQAYAFENDFITAIKEPLVATLVSPQFLFLAEDMAVDPQQRRAVGDYELASRLSYFLWSTMPDETLLGLAGEGKLTKPDVLRAQVDRMLRDERAGEFHRGFMTQWLGLSKLDDLMIEDERWIVRTGLRNSMREEPAQLFAELLRRDASLLNFLDSDFAMLNERLAQHYEIPGVYGNKFRRVSLQPEHARGGLLPQAASMAITTDGMITSPIYRGKWIMETILDLPPPPPPPNVPPLEDAPEVRVSLREQLAKHRESASCAACHKKIDPVGWPLERYSILGEHSEYGWGPNWSEFHDPKRNKEDVRPDLHGTLPGGERVETIDELKRVLLEKHRDDFLRSVTKNLLIYALGRPLDISDDVTIDEIVTHLNENDQHARELVHAVVLSKPFLEK